MNKLEPPHGFASSGNAIDAIDKIYAECVQHGMTFRDSPAKNVAISDYITALVHSKKAWEDTARRYSQNSDWHRKLLEDIGNHFGVAARTADDGRINDNVLLLKIEPLVVEMIEQNRLLKEQLDRSASNVGTLRQVGGENKES